MGRYELWCMWTRKQNVFWWKNLRKKVSFDGNLSEMFLAPYSSSCVRSISQQSTSHRPTKHSAPAPKTIIAKHLALISGLERQRKLWNCLYANWTANIIFLWWETAGVNCILLKDFLLEVFFFFFRKIR